MQQLMVKFRELAQLEKEIMAKFTANSKPSGTLVTIPDILLPSLMSGDIHG